MFRINSVVLNKASPEKMNKISKANIAIAMIANQHNFPDVAQFFEQSSLDVVMSKSSNRLKDNRERSPLIHQGVISSAARSDGNRTPNEVRER